VKDLASTLAIRSQLFNALDDAYVRRGRVTAAATPFNKINNVNMPVSDSLKRLVTFSSNGYMLKQEIILPSHTPHTLREAV
jgi:hypothetical protein